MAFDPLTAGIDLVKEGIKRIWPSPMTKEEEAKVEQIAKDSFNNFIIQYEGAAKDYKDVPIVGPIVLLFRGLVRPLITCLVGYLDYRVILGTGFNDLQMELIKAMTLLVLFFWFGERAVQNTGLLGAVSKLFKKVN